MSQITQQPMSWTSISIANIDAIEQFKSVDSLSINHGFSLNKVLTNVPMQAKYGILNNRGEQLFSAFEESDLFDRIFSTKGREFTMHVLDNYGRELIRVHRELQSCSGCNCCGSCEGCMQQVTVECPPGQIIGTVQQEGSRSGMNYVIKDVNNIPMLTIMGPSCICNGVYSCGCENKYIVSTDRTTEIGVIDKKYPESMQLSSANPVAFTVNFPLNLDTKMKILILGALFLIDIGNYQMLRLRN
ncbi:unnamed protein product [Rotaria sp. Silwood1]|nr:unnamed protein product [Rotaria sp. Silwood1]CAF3640337.1 unnamed protein product [Rotaria sp. Silwood1]CAF4944331.1 unnamed protein product [Rotaria sp. Silwood1]CAF5083340.1 unnamed protein product [Rotaria sp. Silwood1]